MRGHQRRLGQRVGEGEGAGGILDHRPVEQDALVVVAGPFDIGKRDPAEHAAPDRVDHARVAQGRDVAFTLQARLDRIDAARDVDREHQLEVDPQVRGAGAGVGRADQADHQGAAARQLSE